MQIYFDFFFAVVIFGPFHWGHFHGLKLGPFAEMELAGFWVANRIALNHPMWYVQQVRDCLKRYMNEWDDDSQQNIHQTVMPLMEWYYACGRFSDDRCVITDISLLNINANCSEFWSSFYFKKKSNRFAEPFGYIKQTTNASCYSIMYIVTFGYQEIALKNRKISII